MKRRSICTCLRIALFVGLSVHLMFGAEVLASSGCNESPGFYAHSHYRIGRVLVSSQFDYLSSVRRTMESAVALKGVSPGKEYASDLVLAGHEEIRRRLNVAAASLGLPVTANVVIASIRDCDSNPDDPSLTVSYYAFVSWFPISPIATFDTRRDGERDPDRAANLTSGFHLVPKLNYDATLQTSGGVEGAIKTPLGHFALDLSASPSGTLLEATQSISVQRKDRWTRHVELNTGYRYADVPVDISRVKRARLASQLTITSAALSAHAAVVRFGASVEGGHDQSGRPPVGLPLGTRLNNSAGSVKAFSGMSLEGANHSFNGSFGIEFGQMNIGANLDYVKQLVDGVYVGRIGTTNPHKPVDIDLHATAGWITSLNSIPYGERFFGGNHDYNFLLGDSWRIRSQPYIRSFPQNSLNRVGNDDALGGESFVSANLTVAIPVWQRSLVPREVTASENFDGLMQGQLNSGEAQIVAFWKSKDKMGEQALQAAPAAVRVMREAAEALHAISGRIPEDMSDQYDDCATDVLIDEEYITALETKVGKQSERFNAIEAMTQKEEGSFTALSGCMSTFRSQIGSTTSDPIISRLKGVNQSMLESLSKIDTTLAKKSAANDMAFVRRTVNRLLYEMNFGSVSPVLAVDIARIGSQSIRGDTATRYGVGGGIRLMLLDSLRLTAGYSFNPNPRSWEGRGAAFFGLDVLKAFH
jgi:hypothetical protein